MIHRWKEETLVNTPVKKSSKNIDFSPSYGCFRVWNLLKSVTSRFLWTPVPAPVWSLQIFFLYFLIPLLMFYDCVQGHYLSCNITDFMAVGLIPPPQYQSAPKSSIWIGLRIIFIWWKIFSALSLIEKYIRSVNIITEFWKAGNLYFKFFNWNWISWCPLVSSWCGCISSVFIYSSCLIALNLNDMTLEWSNFVEFFNNSNLTNLSAFTLTQKSIFHRFV